jgi:hypothetical protein
VESIAGISLVFGLRVAFANLRRSLRKGGGLCSIAFRAASENPFMIAAERAAAPLLSDVLPRRPDAPAQFALANQDRVQKILPDSGWSDMDGFRGHGGGL